MDIPKAGKFIKLLTWLTEVWLSFATPTAGRILISTLLHCCQNWTQCSNQELTQYSWRCSCNGALIIKTVWVFYKAEFMQSVTHKQQIHVLQLHILAYIQPAGSPELSVCHLAGCCQAAVIEIIFTSWWEVIYIIYATLRMVSRVCALY